MKRTIHFFDLDRTLWSIDTKIWIIDKNKPEKPLFKLNKEETTYILSGIYKNDNNKVEYNGNVFWISDKMFDKIKRKRKSITLNDIGISFIEKTNPEYYKKLKFFIENIRHLVGKEDIDIGILSARYNVDNDNKLLLALKEELEEIGLEINKFYYVGTSYNYINSNKIGIDKMKVLLEHLVGLHIRNNTFIPIKQDVYKEVHFYDDEYQNINIANKIQKYFEEYLLNTTDDILFDRIKNRLNEEPILYTHLITNNQLNRFKTTKVELTFPVKYAIKLEENKIIRNFNNFK